MLKEIFKFDKPEHIVRSISIILMIFSIALFSIGYAIDSEQLKMLAQIAFFVPMSILFAFLLLAMICLGILNSVSDIKKKLNRNRTKKK